jgi:hypothetical protein
LFDHDCNDFFLVSFSSISWSSWLDARGVVIIIGTQYSLDKGFLVYTQFTQFITSVEFGQYIYVQHIPSYLYVHGNRLLQVLPKTKTPFPDLKPCNVP